MRTVELVAGGVAGGSFLVLPLTGRTMRFAARVLTLALLPALPAARSSPRPAARQGSTAGSGAASQTAVTERDDWPGRLS